LVRFPRAALRLRLQRRNPRQSRLLSKALQALLAHRLLRDLTVGRQRRRKPLPQASDLEMGEKRNLTALDRRHPCQFLEVKEGRYCLLLLLPVHSVPGLISFVGIRVLFLFISLYHG
jgi:hypothetical protein